MAPEARFEADGEKLLEDPHIDVVVASLPWNLTEKWLPRLLRTPKPVLIEKPIALSSRSLREALAASKGHAENKTVGFNRRFYNTVQKMKERLQQGGLKSVEIVISETVERLAERYGRDIVKHILVYSSCHTLDAALYLLGPLNPVRIYAYEDPRYEGHFRSLNGLVETAQGAPVLLAINADAPVPMGLHFHFDDGSAWILSPLERLRAYQGYEVVEPTPESPIRRYLPKTLFEMTAESVYKPGFLEQMKAFTEGAARDVAASLADGLNVLDFIEAIQNTRRNA